MKNPYAGAMVLKNGDPITDLRFGKSQSGSRMLDEQTGEINAGSKADAVKIISQLMALANSGEIQKQGPQVSNSAARSQELEERRELLAAAKNDPALWASLGASVALQIQEQRDRMGFMRRILQGTTLRQGDLSRIIVQQYDATAVVATSSAKVEYQVIRSNGGLPIPEFEIIGNLRVENIDLQQIGGDLLDNVYNQGIQAIMVGEDRLVKAALDATVNTRNAITYISGSLTPAVLGTLRQQVAGWGLPATTALISNDYWADIMGSTEFSSFLDPITKYDLVMNGQIATLVGMTLITDAFRAPNQKVLERGDIYVLTEPENLGGYTDRGGVVATPTSGADSGNTTRGWLLSEVLGVAITNPRGCAKGKRV